MRNLASGEDRNGTPPKTPEKTALFENRAAQCGAVPFDAAKQAEFDPNLRVIMDAWPSLSAPIRRAIMAFWIASNSSIRQATFGVL